MLKKWGNLRKDWNLASIKLVINFSTRLNKVEELIQLITDNEEAWDMVRTIYFQDTFLFTYDVWGSVDVNSNYPNPGHNVNNFKLSAIVAVEF